MTEPPLGVKSTPLTEVFKAIIEKTRPTWLTRVRQTTAVFIWTYIFVKLFVYDIDFWMLNKFAPNYAYILKYKFLFLLALIIVLSILPGKGKTRSWLLYITFFPFLLTFITFPLFLIRTGNWVLTFAILNSFFLFFKNIKYNLVAVPTLVLSLFLVSITENSALLALLIMALGILLISIYVRSVFLIYRPPGIYQLYYKFIRGARENIFKDAFSPKDDLKKLHLGQMTKPQQDSWRTCLEVNLRYNRISLYLARKLNQYQESKIDLLFYSINFLVLILTTMILFCGINYALFKAHPSSFLVTGMPGFFDFVYYSFKTYIFAGIDEIKPLDSMAKFLSMLECFFAIICALILISLFLFVKADKSRADILSTVKNLEDEGTLIEEMVQRDFRISLPKALEELKKLQSSLLEIILWFSSRIEK